MSSIHVRSLARHSSNPVCTWAPVIAFSPSALRRESRDRLERRLESCHMVQPHRSPPSLTWCGTRRVPGGDSRSSDAWFRSRQTRAASTYAPHSRWRGCARNLRPESACKTTWSTREDSAASRHCSSRSNRRAAAARDSRRMCRVQRAVVLDTTPNHNDQRQAVCVPSGPMGARDRARTSVTRSTAARTSRRAMQHTDPTRSPASAETQCAGTATATTCCRRHCHTLTRLPPPALPARYAKPTVLAVPRTTTCVASTAPTRGGRRAGAHRGRAAQPQVASLHHKIRRCAGALAQWSECGSAHARPRRIEVRACPAVPAQKRARAARTKINTPLVSHWISSDAAQSS